MISQSFENRNMTTAKTEEFKSQFIFCFEKFLVLFLLLGCQCSFWHLFDGIKGIALRRRWPTTAKVQQCLKIDFRAFKSRGGSPQREKKNRLPLKQHKQKQFYIIISNKNFLRQNKWPKLWFKPTPLAARTLVPEASRQANSETNINQNHLKQLLREFSYSKIVFRLWAGLLPKPNGLNIWAFYS